MVRSITTPPLWELSCCPLSASPSSMALSASGLATGSPPTDDAGSALGPELETWTRTPLECCAKAVLAIAVMRIVTTIIAAGKLNCERKRLNLIVFSLRLVQTMLGLCAKAEVAEAIKPIAASPMLQVRRSDFSDFSRAIHY